MGKEHSPWGGQAPDKQRGSCWQRVSWDLKGPTSNEGNPWAVSYDLESMLLRSPLGRTREDSQGGRQKFSKEDPNHCDTWWNVPRLTPKTFSNNSHFSKSSEVEWKPVFLLPSFSVSTVLQPWLLAQVFPGAVKIGSFPLSESQWELPGRRLVKMTQLPTRSSSLLSSTLTLASEVNEDSDVSRTTYYYCAALSIIKAGTNLYMKNNSNSKHTNKTEQNTTRPRPSPSGWQSF